MRSWFCVAAPNSYIYIDASLKTEQQRAKLISPTVAADTGPLCLIFSYQLWGEAQGHLRVLLRDPHNEESILWTLKDDQGPVWKEGRTILPRSPKDFQVGLSVSKCRSLLKCGPNKPTVVHSSQGFWVNLKSALVHLKQTEDWNWTKEKKSVFLSSRKKHPWLQPEHGPTPKLFEKFKMWYGEVRRSMDSF